MVIKYLRTKFSAWNIARLGMLILIVGLFSCSTKKNTMLSRSYHNLTSHYNVYFNGKEAYKTGVKRMETSYTDNYSNILPIFKYSDKDIANSIGGDMDKAILKASKLIKIHSITAKPKRKKRSRRMSPKERAFMNQKEYNKWIDDAYLLMGKANFHKHEYVAAKENFDYVLREYPKNEIRFETNEWLARNFIETGEFDEARKCIQLIEGDRNTPKKVQKRLHALNADFYIKQKKFSEAIPHLEEAIDVNRKKTIKARYSFILGQIYQELDMSKKAAEQYEYVVKLDPVYEMTFNAKIRLATSFEGGSGASDLIKELNKMLKDEKNIEYKDQIYYALANVALKQKKVDDALELYKLSSISSIDNFNQKALSLLAVADIYFFVPDYKNSQTYYDSCISFLDESYEDYEQIYNKSKNLNKLVENLIIIETQDSLQAMAKMTEKERNAVIDKAIEQVKAEEERIKQEMRQRQMNAQRFKQNERDPRNRIHQGSSWYFYNTTSLSFGRSEFIKRWGKRKLEDNWRRRDKSVVDFGDEFANEDGLEEGEEGEEGKKKKLDNKSREFYMQDIPLNDSLLAISDQKIIAAMYKLGEIYKEDFKDYGLSIDAFKSLNTKYPDNVFFLATLYQLYKLHELISQPGKAESYKNEIINRFPDSKYAMMLTNPEYLKELAAEQEMVFTIYTDIYSDYESKKYLSVISKTDDAIEKYPENELLPKFRLIKALAIGYSKTLDDFNESLNSVVKAHPGTDEANQARDILIAINKDNADFVFEDPSMNKEEEKVKEELETNEEEIYSENPEIDHYYICVVDNSVVNVNRLKFNISNFNTDFFSMIDFNVKSVVLDGDFEIITVKSLPGQREAMTYFETISKNKDVYSEIKETDYRHFIISLENYTVFFNDKDVSKYFKYFKKHYQKEK